MTRKLQETPKSIAADRSLRGTDPREPRRVLGRGLDALLPVTATATTAAARADSPYQSVGIERVQPRKDQPRKRFDTAALDELAESIREQGIIQPLVVRRVGDALEIIAGERRWRAAQRAGLHEVPVVIRDATSDSAFELALVENIQRMDLDPVETAYAYQRLMSDHGYSQETLAARVGKDRSTVANTLRLLQLPADVLDRVVAREITEGHARAVLSAHDPTEISRLAQTAATRQWSVRQTEQAARKPRKPVKDPAAASVASETPAPRTSPNVRDLEKRLESALGMSVAVRVDADGRAGTVEIGYDSLDQLDRLIVRLLGS